MTQRLALTALVVRDYDEAIGFYVNQLGFALTSDDDMGGGKRWVVVTPPVEVNLITSAPWLIWARTARRQSSTPLQTLSPSR